MLFALIDYWSYITRRGPYGKDQKDGGMAVANVGELPADTISQLQVGDAIFTQRLDSWKSWAMMFMTSSPVDHVALYIGDGQVGHFTLEGSKKHSLRAITKGARVLPVRFLPNGEEIPFDPPVGRGKIVRRSRPSHVLAPKLQLVWVAIRIGHGFHPERFRWKFAIDGALLGCAIDAVARPISGIWIGIPLAVISLSIVIFNYIRFQIGKWRDKPFEPLSHPDIGYYSFFRHGGLLFSEIGPLIVFRPIGILPLKAFLALGRESPDDPAADKFQEFRQGIRDIVEYLNVGPSSGQAENQKRQQDDVEEGEERSNGPRQAGEKP